jgi:hypothetical protein
MNTVLFKLVFITALFLGPSVNAQTWTDVGGSCFSEGRCRQPSLAISPSGDPYVLYRDDTLSQTANVKAFTAGSWNYVGARGFSDRLIYWPSLAFSADGSPVAAYFGAEPFVMSPDIKKFDGSGAWDALGTFTPTAIIGNFLSLAVGGGDTAFVAYRDDTSSDPAPASVRMFDGVSWTYLGPRWFTPGGVAYTSLATNVMGTLYLAFIDYANGRKASVMKYSAGVWTYVGAAGFSPGIASATSLAIAPDGTPYVAFVDSANAAKLTVMTYDGAAWNNVGTAGFTDGVAEVSTRYLAIDAAGNPYVAYADVAAGSKATVKKFDGTSWTNLGSAAFSPGMASDVALAIGTAGIVYVAFGDGTDSYRARVMKYDATSGVATDDIPKDQVSLYPNPATQMLTITAGEEIRHVSVVNAAGQSFGLVTGLQSAQGSHYKGHSGGLQMSVDISHLPPGAYMVRVNEAWTGKFVKE